MKIQTNSTIEIERDWNNFVKVIDGTEKKLSLQVEESDELYYLFAIDNVILYVCIIYKIGHEPGGMSQELIDENASNLESYLDFKIKNYTNKSTKSEVAIAVSDLSNPPVVSIAQRASVKQYIDCTHNWCDKTSWHTNAKAVTNQTMTADLINPKKYFIDDGNGNPIPYWIDVINFKCYREKTRLKHMKAVVYDNGTIVPMAKFGQTLATNLSNNGVFCKVNHAAGTVEFSEVYTINGPITVDCYYVDPDLNPQKQSEFILKPRPEKKIILERVECQFTKGCEINDSVNFAAFCPLYYMAIQSDNTLNPKNYGDFFELQEGLSFLITDKDNLHESFGTIEGLENNDIVFYKEERDNNKDDGFVVWFDASENASGVAMNLLIAPNPYPTISVWNGSAWSTEQPGMYEYIEIPETRDTYNVLFDYINDCNGNYPILEEEIVSSLNGRGSPYKIQQFAFEWLGSKPISGKNLVELRVWLEDGQVFGPNDTHRCTASFYGTIHKDL